MVRTVPVMRSIYELLLIISLLGLTVTSHAETHSLNSFIHHYEPLSYDVNDLMWNHHRVCRSFVGPKEINLKFHALGRDFDLQLFPDTDLFHPDFTLNTGSQTLRKHSMRSYFYSGFDRNDPSARVRGNVVHGVFEGAVVCDEDVYHIEPAQRYLNESNTFHSIIYRHSDLDTSPIAGATCGSAKKALHKKLSVLQRSVIRNERSIARRNLEKRQTTRDTSLVRCWLNVIGDNRVYGLTSGSQRDRVVQVTSLLSTIISTASMIYERTDFNNDGQGDRIQFGIQNLTILSESPPPGSFLANDFIGVEAFLDRYSTADYQQYCLSYLFTYRDFDDGVLGLAYIAAQPNSGGGAGGICERYQTFAGGVRKTLNTGIVSLLNYGRRVPTGVSALTFAHEAGHSFGSPHDPDSNPACVPPTSAGGKYIMYAFATDGTHPNNDDFSPCSRTMMNAVIADRGQTGTSVPNDNRPCFVEADNLCGNNLVDPGEDCDCGGMTNRFANGTCIQDRCCNGTSCRTRSDVECSPGQGVCCDSFTCTFVPDGAMNCSEENECAFAQTCNGTSAFCPAPEPKSPSNSETFISCNGGANLCMNGQCTGTVCVSLGLRDCECPTDAESCHICCRLTNQTCASTIRIAAENTGGMRDRLPNSMGRYHQVGFPCSNFTGYCDFFNRCMVVNSDGAINRLANIFNSEAFLQAIDWIREMWWAVLLVGLGVLVIMFFIVLICHLILPRPEHAKMRAERRKTIRQSRKVQQGRSSAVQANLAKQKGAPGASFAMKNPSYPHNSHL